MTASSFLGSALLVEAGAAVCARASVAENTLARVALAMRDEYEVLMMGRFACSARGQGRARSRWVTAETARRDRCGRTSFFFTGKETSARVETHRSARPAD